jgi:hypothetical protein
MAADFKEYEHVAKLLAEIRPVSVRDTADAGRLEVPLSPPTSLFMEGIALKHGLDPAQLAGFLLDSLVADEDCMRQLLERRRARD